MATQLEPCVKDDLKTQFVTREGTYRLLTLSEYSRPNRVGYTNSQNSPQVRVSIVTLPSPSSTAVSAGLNGSSSNMCANGQVINGSAANSNSNNGENAGIGSTVTNGGQQSVFAVPSTLESRLGAGVSMHSMVNGMNVLDQNSLANQIYGGDRICFNFGRELYVYAFRGAKKGSELSKPIDKKFYKGTNPSCHDFNASTATPTGAPLLVGFTTGQIQLVSPQPGPREVRKLYNEERLIDKTKVTCVKWLPNSPNLFLASHASGHLYLYNEELSCMATPPNYQLFKEGDGYSIHTCKSKTTRNPLYKWIFNTDNCCINEFCFSPCGSNLAIVSQDGFLRVFHYDTMDLLGVARSYFGGFLCVCWSPDGKYIVVGGEDDLVTVWSLYERRVVARGQGHRSWVSVVAFDPYTTSYTNWDSGDFSDDENQLNEYAGGGGRDMRYSTDSTPNGFDFPLANDKNSTPNHIRQRPHSASFRSDASSAALAPDKLAISYRLGSVGQDTQLCLWDITEDVLRHPLPLRQRLNSTNVNDTSQMNGGIDSDGIKVIRPVAIGSTICSFPPPQHTHAGSPTKENTAIGENKHSNSNSNSNSSSGKFSTANCTVSSQSSNANTPPDECNHVPTGTSASSNSNSNSTVKASSNPTKSQSTGNTLKLSNCMSITKSDSIDCGNGNGNGNGNSNGNGNGNSKGNGNGKSNSSFFSSSTHNSKTSNSSIKSSDSGLSTFNSLTQRLTSFSFLNSDKKSSGADVTHSSTMSSTGGSTAHRNHRKGMSLLKSYNQNNTGNANFVNSTVMEVSGNMASSMAGSSTAHSFGSFKIGKTSTNSQISTLGTPSHNLVTSYDPMKLIGTPACPRFDECPLLEPLVCKKIAHERLSALIFREDCFLTACQDGFIYTWARPGYGTNVPQHLSPSQTVPPGGTVI